MSLNILPRLASTVIIAFVATSCSDGDEPSTPVSSTNPNQPAASTGGAANAGTAGAAGFAGAGGASTAPSASGGANSEVAPTPALNQGGNAASDAGASAGAAPGPVADAAAPAADDNAMSFFLASRGSGNGGNFGGIAGADALCETLAAAADPALAAKTWHAYLSTSAENARDRIGAGPWRNAAGVVIANNVDELHDQAPSGASEANYPLGSIDTALREDGSPLPPQPVLHDILTGSNLDGTLSASGTCSDWTATTGTTRNGHSNRAGGGQNPSSWNSAHDTACGPATPDQNFQMGTVSQGGGIGAIYCFALD